MQLMRLQQLTFAMSPQMNAEHLITTDAPEQIICQPWSTRLSKMTQPNLDYNGTQYNTHT